MSSEQEIPVRYKLTDTNNLMVLLSEMSDGDNAAFDVLTDAMGQCLPDDFASLVKALDDKNIRGAQIPVALEVAGDLPALISASVNGMDKFIDTINEKYEGPHKAVLSGAADAIHIERPVAKPARRLVFKRK